VPLTPSARNEVQPHRQSARAKISLGLRIAEQYANGGVRLVRRRDHDPRREQRVPHTHVASLVADKVEAIGDPLGHHVVG
jgi:hypothetical protein